MSNDRTVKFTLRLNMLNPAHVNINKVLTRLALEQMKEIVHYISNDLMAPDAADNLLDKMKAEITKLSSFPKKHALIFSCSYISHTAGVYRQGIRGAATNEMGFRNTKTVSRLPCYRNFQSRGIRYNKKRKSDYHSKTNKKNYTRVTTFQL